MMKDAKMKIAMLDRAVNNPCPEMAIWHYWVWFLDFEIPALIWSDAILSHGQIEYRDWLRRMIAKHNAGIA